MNVQQKKPCHISIRFHPLTHQQLVGTEPNISVQLEAAEWMNELSSMAECMVDLA